MLRLLLFACATFAAASCANYLIPIRGDFKPIDHTGLYVSYNVVKGGAFIESGYLIRRRYSALPLAAFITRQQSTNDFSLEFSYVGADWIHFKSALISDSGGTLFWDLSRWTKVDTIGDFGMRFEHATVSLSRIEIDSLSTICAASHECTVELGTTTYTIDRDVIDAIRETIAYYRSL